MVIARPLPLLHLAAFLASLCWAAPVTNYYYVSLDSAAPGAPYGDWNTAAHDIQTAVTEAEGAVVPGVTECVVIVSNGTYTLAGELAISGAIAVSGLTGDPLDVIVDGGYPVSQNRCLRLTGAAVVEGLTFTNGYVGAGSVPTNWGGGIYMTTGTVRNCRIVGNRAMRIGTINARGAGVYMEGGTLSNCVVQTNLTDGISGCGVYADGAGCLVTDCRVLDNGRSDVSNTQGGGLYLRGKARAVRCTIAGNSSRTSGGGVYMGDSSGAAALSQCAIRNNYAYDGAGVYVYYYGDVENCAITHNKSFRYGGGLYLNSRGSLVRNCLIACNESATLGGGVENSGGGAGVVRLRNCTVANNASGTGGGLYVAAIANDMECYNTIVHSNSAATASNNIYFANERPAVRYTCTDPVLAGEGNIGGDPGFATPGGGHGQAAILGDYRLARSSACRDAGTNDVYVPAFDLLMNKRPSPEAGRVDMGAYEFQVPAGVVLVFR